MSAQTQPNDDPRSAAFQPTASNTACNICRPLTPSGANDRIAHMRSIWCASVAARRWALLLGAAILTVTGLWALAPAVLVSPATWEMAAAAVLLGVLCLFGHFNWLLWVVGFVAWRHRPRSAENRATAVTTRTAIVMPIYHEDVDRVARGVRATWRSIKSAGLSAHCDYFILSDSTDNQVREAEVQALVRLLPEFGGNADRSGRLFLVRRSDRSNFKAGNIANFVARHGGAYDFMVVLDADSVMLGSCIRGLILAMQDRPKTAVIQSLMSTFRGSTPFAQATQFSVTRLGEIFSCGFAWFLGREAMYWGHNAIIRIAPFAEHAQLPIMPGQPPLGGPVLSQDVHEASLLGRAGWDVELDLEPGGSFEEIPANVVSYGKRDQRWCTGDFLNSALILAKGFRTGQRVWLGYAVMSYVQSLVLLSLMLLGFGLAVNGPQSSLDTRAFVWALVYMPILQLGSKVLLLFMHWSRDLSAIRQVTSFCADVLAGLLITPLLVYQHITFVLSILLGKPVKWTSPSRNPNDGVDWVLAARVFWVPTLVAAVWIPLAWVFAPSFLFFAGTMLVPWLFSIPLAVLSSDARLGAWLARTGVFACRRTPEELEELGNLVCGTSDEWWLEHGKKSGRAHRREPEGRGGGVNGSDHFSSRAVAQGAVSDPASTSSRSSP